VRNSFALLLLCASLAATGCSRSRSTGISVDRAFRPLISPKIRVLAGFDLDRLKTTGLYQRHREELNFPLLNASSERIGLDPRRDISKGIVTWNGRDSLLVVRGPFRSEVVQNKLVSSGAKRSQYGPYTLIGNEREALLFLKSGIAAAGSTSALRSGIDLENKGTGEVPEELAERLRTLPKDDQIWVVSRGGLPFAELPMRSDIGSAVSNIVQFIRGTTVGITAGDGMMLQGELTCVSEDGAKRVRDALKGGLGLARLTTKDNELDLLRLWDAFQIQQDGALVHVKANLSDDLSDKLLARIPRIGTRAGRAQ